MYHYVWCVVQVRAQVKKAHFRSSAYSSFAYSDSTITRRRLDVLNGSRALPSWKKSGFEKACQPAICTIFCEFHSFIVILLIKNVENIYMFHKYILEACGRINIVNWNIKTYIDVIVTSYNGSISLINIHLYNNLLYGQY